MDKCPFCGADNRRNCVRWGKVNFSQTTKSDDGKMTLLTEAQYKKWRNENCKDRQIAQLEERLAAWRELWDKRFWQEEDAESGLDGWLKAKRKLKDLGEI